MPIYGSSAGANIIFGENNIGVAFSGGGVTGVIWNADDLTNTVLSDSNKTATTDAITGAWGNGTITSTAQNTVNFTLNSNGYQVMTFGTSSSFSGTPWGSRYGYFFQGAGGSYAIERGASSSGSMDTTTTWSDSDTFTMTVDDTTGIRLLKNDVEIDDFTVASVSDDPYLECHLNSSSASANTGCTLTSG